MPECFFTWADHIFAWFHEGAASNFLEHLYWIAGLIAAWFAVAALRQNSKQAKATFMLRLDERWEELSTSRKHVSEFKEKVAGRVLAAHARLGDEARIEKLREEYKKIMEDTEQNDPWLFKHLLEYLGFFETVGLMVKERYVSLEDVIGLYKGPVLDLDDIFGKFIEECQARANVPVGLFENALYLVKEVKKATDRA